MLKRVLLTLAVSTAFAPIASAEEMKFKVGDMFEATSVNGVPIRGAFVHCTPDTAMTAILALSRYGGTEVVAIKVNDGFAIDGESRRLKGIDNCVATFE